MLKKLHWLPVGDEINFKVLFLVYRALHEQPPEIMTDMLQEICKVQTLRSTVSSQLAFPRSRIKGFGDHAFSIVVPETGMLCQDLSLIVNLLGIFIKGIKSHLLKSAFN